MKLPCVDSWATMKRSTTLKYRGWSLPVTVSSIDQQIDLQVKAALHGWGVELELIQALPAEQDICVADANRSCSKMDVTVLSKHKAARKFAMELVAKEEKITGAKCK
eukprot:5238061-Amphidinium_carterae.1